MKITKAYVHYFFYFGKQNKVGCACIIFYTLEALHKKIKSCLHHLLYPKDTTQEKINHVHTMCCAMPNARLTIGVTKVELQPH
jgi:hypothetical protein